MRFTTVAAAIWAAVLVASPALAINFSDAGGWRSPTSLTPSVTNRGDAVKVSWSVAPDGTIDAYTGLPSNLRATWTARYGADYMTVFRFVFNRIGSVSGLQFVETTDDGAIAGGMSKGAAGVRGDFRVIGCDIDGWYTKMTGGPWGGGAWCNLPDANSTVIMNINTSLIWPSLYEEQGFVMHEAGHGIGFGHQRIYADATTTQEYTDGNNHYASMTGFVNANGPQFDDLYAMHRMYGDINERNGGNDSTATATDFGDLTGKSKSLGTQINGLLVGPDETDFLSIDGTTDMDIFHFSLSQAMKMTFKLTPKGPQYYYDKVDSNRLFMDGSRQSDLYFDLCGADGLAFAHINSGGLGEMESVTSVLQGGDYFIEIAGTEDANQFYRIDVVSEPVPEPSSLLALLAGAGLAAGMIRHRTS